MKILLDECVPWPMHKFPAAILAPFINPVAGIFKKRRERFSLSWRRGPG